MADILDPDLLASTGLLTIPLASSPNERESGNKRSFPELLSVSTLDMLAANSNAQLPSSTNELGLKNEKLGIEGTGDENSKPLESSFPGNENPLEAKQGVNGSAMREEKDDLQVNAGDSASHKLGDPAPKLMS